MPDLDLDYIRSQFPAFSHAETGQWAFFENAGGSYAAGAVVDQLQHFMTATKMQPYGTSAPSQAAGAAMDRSHELLAAAINASPDEVMFGPSTSINTYIVARAMESLLQAGDEVIVTNQDHEANVGAWSRLAESNSGIIVREWPVNPESGLLDLGDLGNLINDRTRLVCVNHCSNIVGAVNDIRAIAEKVHQSGALLAVDGVSFAPHLAVDVKALDADFYYFSLYKVFGPHQGLLYVRRDVLDRLPNQGHFFNAASPGKRLTPAGPQHGEIACASGIVDYLLGADRYHFPNDEAQDDVPLGDVHRRVERMMDLGHAHEVDQANRILDLLKQKRVRIIGEDRAQIHKRAPTIAFTGASLKPSEIGERLADQTIAVGADHFYAYRLIKALGVDPDEGVVRISLVHYTSVDDVDRLLSGLDDIL